MPPESPRGRCATASSEQDHGLDRALDHQFLELCRPAIEDRAPVKAEVVVTNVNRTVGTLLGYEITRRHGGAGLPEGTIDLTFRDRPARASVRSSPRG